MSHVKEIVLNGIRLDGSRPIHPLLMSYFSKIGYKLSTKDGYIIINGGNELPNKQMMFAYLVELSKEKYNDVIFDLDIYINEFDMRSFEIVDKKPNDASQISRIIFENYDQGIIDLIFAKYLLHNDAVVYFDKNNKLCYLAGNEPIDQNIFMFEATSFISESIDRMNIQPLDATSNNKNSFTDSFQSDSMDPEVSDLLAIKYGLVNNCQLVLIEDSFFYINNKLPDVKTFREQKQKFIASEYLELQNKGIILSQNFDLGYSQGIYTAFSNLSNWIVDSINEVSEAINIQTPKPSL